MNTQTQCPHCHTCYPMPASRLDNPDLKATCKNCGNSFFPNRHLITNDSTVASVEKPKQAQSPTQEQPKIAQEDPALPKIPLKKKKTKVIKEGMIHDGMETEQDSVDFSISDEELNDFMKRTSVPLATPMATASTKDTSGHIGDDEAWLDALLKNDDSPNITVVPYKPQQKQDIPLIAGEDLTARIPEVHQHEDPKVLMEKMQARLASAPTQEQIATKRNPFSSIGWLLGCLAMLVLGLSQYVYFNQQAIAKNPNQAALVKQLCPPCQIPSADLNAFKINYQLQTGSADFSTNLVGVLSNHTTTQQLYPNLKIVVMGANGVLGELVLAPKDYLIIEKILMGAKTDERFMLTLDVPQDAVSSVQIEPFY